MVYHISLYGREETSLPGFSADNQANRVGERSPTHSNLIDSIGPLILKLLISNNKDHWAQVGRQDVPTFLEIVLS